MSGWLDRWAKASAARESRRQRQPAGEPPSGLSRRDLLKRAGVAAGAAWTVPLIQSAVAPAAAASGGGCSSGCAPGAPCTSNAMCATGHCLQGICAQPGKKWSGSRCGQSFQCYSGVCSNGFCAPGALSSPCRSIADCGGGANCSALTQTCGGTGAKCIDPLQCVSGYCDGTYCAAPPPPP